LQQQPHMVTDMDQVTDPDTIITDITLKSAMEGDTVAEMEVTEAAMVVMADMGAAMVVMEDMGAVMAVMGDTTTIIIIHRTNTSTARLTQRLATLTITGNIEMETPFMANTASTFLMAQNK